MVKMIPWYQITLYKKMKWAGCYSVFMFIVCITIMNRLEIMNKFTPDNFIEYNYLLISSTTFQSLSSIDLFFRKKGVLIFCMEYNCPKYWDDILFARSYICHRTEHCHLNCFAKETFLPTQDILLGGIFSTLRFC